MLRVSENIVVPRARAINKYEKCPLPVSKKFPIPRAKSEPIMFSTIELSEKPTITQTVFTLAHQHW